jgi:hypothetical protein
MKLLVIHTAEHPDQDKRSAVDRWRLQTPVRELRKHCPDWQIDERPSVIPEIQKYKDKREFTETELNQAFEDLCSYDVIWSSYQSNPTIFSLLQVVQDRGTGYIMDVDDNMFAINEDNPVWLALNDKNVLHMQLMIRSNRWLSTTTEELASVFRERRPDHESESVFVNPNFINDDYQHPKFDNDPIIRIGFFGGSSHYGDLHNTGVLPAIERLMHEYKNVHFVSTGMPIDHYLPKSRFTLNDAKKGDAWLKSIYPNLNYDISIAPLEDNLFNKGKSNIKWQESTRMGSLFVASDVGPYAGLPTGTAMLTKNSPEAWYKTLKQAIDNTSERQQTIQRATQALQDYRLETHWQTHKNMIETVAQKASIKRYVTI